MLNPKKLNQMAHFVIKKRKKEKKDNSGVELEQSVFVYIIKANV
jgi:hypothetical protein